MNVSEPMLTYRKEEHGSTLVASAWSWTIEKRRALSSDVWTGMIRSRERKHGER
ncbi:hypothetical protein [Bacillus sp. FJAT-42315]|uniref:hypothetical protein n=1 Tax=Bacillus sp. FJAT-42315 TaxID=2014077 RepID=UPI0012FEB262|nr:hypothetical protein [Bacillus sp. FJAT-42315]